MECGLSKKRKKRNSLISFNKPVLQNCIHYFSNIIFAPWPAKLKSTVYQIWPLDKKSLVTLALAQNVTVSVRKRGGGGGREYRFVS